MKAFRNIVYILLIFAVVGLLAYQGLVTKELTGSDLTRALLILAGLLLSLLRTRKPAGSKKALYKKAYGEFIRDAFSEDPKLEKRLFAAIDDYNREKPGAAVEKLTRLRRECNRTDEIYAVAAFTALCLDDMGLYHEAIQSYRAALALRRNTTLASNMGLCHQQLGEFEKAEAAYELAIDIQPDNAYAYSNLSSLYFRQADYESSLDYAQHALDIDSKLPQALSTSAICFALLGYEEEYREHYRRAVAAGYDGSKIKAAIRNLDPSL